MTDDAPPTAAQFEEWLHGSDIINGFMSFGNDEAKSRTIAMLKDGQLQGAAGQMIFDGRDLGLALIPRELWGVIARSNVWSTGRFECEWRSPEGELQRISGYDVRIDPNIRELPRPDPALRLAQPSHKPPTETPPKNKGGRTSGHHGIVIATIAKRLMALPAAALEAYAPRRLQSELIEEYRAHGCEPPSANNIETMARGILKALRN